MNTERLQPILDKIEDYEHIIIFRHLRPDGDCLGASKGLQRMLRLSYPDKRIDLPESDAAEHLRFLGADDAPLKDENYGDALGIVVDTGSAGRISNPKYVLCKELIKIDHHPDKEPYAALSWVEEKSASACQMIAAFYDFFKPRLKLDRETATFLFCGMVTDSVRFRSPDTDGDSLRYAALMLDAGVDTEGLYAQLYLRDEKSLRLEAYVYEHFRQTENGAAYFYADKAVQTAFGLSFEDASDAVDWLSAVRGCLVWLAFIDAPDGSVRVRLRSRFVSVAELAERFHGGGHANAAGATVYGKREMSALIAQADEIVKQYKEKLDDGHTKP